MFGIEMEPAHDRLKSPVAGQLPQRARTHSGHYKFTGKWMAVAMRTAVVGNAGLFALLVKRAGMAAVLGKGETRNPADSENARSSPAAISWSQELKRGR